MTDQSGAPSGDRQSTTYGSHRGCCQPEARRDSPVVAGTADFDGRGSDHTAEGGGAIRPLSLRVHHLGYEQYLVFFLRIFRRTVYGMVVWIVRRMLDLRSIC